VINYTGGTEVSGGILSSVVVKPIRPAGFNAASAGLAADVVDAKSQPVTGEIGELAIRAPFIGMTRSFWQDDARYLDTYWSAIPGLWAHGDLAMRDASGTFFLMGRSDDTMKIAGKRVGPAEVEEIIVELPDVTEAAVIGVDDALKGQAIVAFITGAALQSSDDLTRTIRQRVQDRLGKPFAPREVHVVSDLPKIRSTKVIRRMIRNVYAGRLLGDTTSLVNPSALEIIAETLTDHRGRNGNGS
jgi:acetyl-CoA synthetase